MFQTEVLAVFFELVVKLLFKGLLAKVDGFYYFVKFIFDFFLFLVVDFLDFLLLLQDLLLFLIQE